MARGLSLSIGCWFLGCVLGNLRVTAGCLGRFELELSSAQLVLVVERWLELSLSCSLLSAPGFGRLLVGRETWGDLGMLQQMRDAWFLLFPSFFLSWTYFSLAPSELRA